MARNVERQVLQDPPVARFLFGDTRVAWVWLLLRLYVGYSWIDASLHKLSSAGWMSDGSALAGFWKGAVAAPDGKPVVAFDWYRSFLLMMLNGGHYVWFAKLVAVGEFMIGLGLILGAFVGVAALFGAFMNWNFIMAGSASTNGMLLVLAVLLVLAWKVAGYWGLDRFLLRAVGTPWAPGELIQRANPGILRPAPQSAPGVRT